MKNIRTYGKIPYKTALIHGGPGAAGDMRPVAEELSKYFSVIEPLQTKKSIDELLKELHLQICSLCHSPITVTGHSWGAWLGIIFAAKYPELVNKLILISSGPFEESYTLKMMEDRINHLNEDDRSKYFSLIQDSGGIMTEELGYLLSKADTFEQLPEIETPVDFSPDIYLYVWNEAKKLRQSGKLIDYCKNLKCPVTAIHGKYDTHPAIGVSEPLTKAIKDFKMILLDKCGHYPWKEKYARKKFFELLVELV